MAAKPTYNFFPTFLKHALVMPCVLLLSTQLLPGVFMTVTSALVCGWTLTILTALFKPQVTLGTTVSKILYYALMSLIFLLTLSALNSFIPMLFIFKLLSAMAIALAIVATIHFVH
jgi:hypothetical protein